MSLGRLFGLFRRTPPASEPQVVTPEWTGPLDDTPVHRLLDAVGIPWRLSRAELARRYGVTTDPAYQWPVIEIPTDPPLVDGLVRPLSAQAFPELSPRAPATEFSGVVSLGADPRRNIEAALRQLVPHLGEQRVGRQYNTLRAEWRFGRASLALTVWPPELQSHGAGVPAHERDPRLATGCHVHVRTGLRLAPSPAERAWLDSFVEIERVDADSVFTPERHRITDAAPTELEFIRELPDGYDHLFGRLGRSGDGEALILCRYQLYVIPAADVTSLQVSGLLPGRGGGGAWLYLVVATHEPDCPEKQILVCSGNAAGDLDDTGRRLAKALGVPVTIEEPGYDI